MDSALRALYTLLWLLALPLVGLRLLWRSRKQPEYLQHVGERFGLGGWSHADPCIWLHSVSVGETRAAQPLVRALLEHYPGHRILLTHMTPTGRATARELFGKELRVESRYLPYDLPWCVRSFLRSTRPALGIVMETEVWPNLMAATLAENIPTVLVNARLSERSARGYKRIGALARPAFAAFTRILAQSEADAERLRSLGAGDVHVCGNMKFDLRLDEDKLALGDRFKALAGNRPVLLAASTREGEEALLLEAFTRHCRAEVLLVLVPRHPQRFDEVAQLVERNGLTLARRSAGEQPIGAGVRVWLGDSMGEMLAYYRMADAALIGGSWLPLGGQNLIEACAVGTPVLIGPHTFNFAEATEGAIAAGAARRCPDVDVALKASQRLLDTPSRKTKMRDAGLAFAAAHRGATRRTIDAIKDVMGW
ncbi:MAG: lipid IV(A) 3-deoxy-D-manno-octulosonic acid transferase [Moraxellaceae bacterium]|nr:lipid IV(A) 3-deoxy-D-manno-octulosonic acid transferase [Moraxellaceae bacterium]